MHICYAITVNGHTEAAGSDKAKIVKQFYKHRSAWAAEHPDGMVVVLYRFTDKRPDAFFGAARVEVLDVGSKLSSRKDWYL